MSKYVGLFIISVIISSLSQVLLKKSANDKHSHFIKQYVNVKVVSGYALFFMATFMTILAYKELPLRYGPVINSLSFLFVLLFGHIFLNEKITKRKVIGNIIIIIGIVVFNISL